MALDGKCNKGLEWLGLCKGRESERVGTARWTFPVMLALAVVR